METIKRLHWPKLAWVATLDGRQVLLEHGPAVEAFDDWAFEGTWEGCFVEGDFDRHENVMGTGLRIRGDRVVFAPPSHTCDKLYYVQATPSSPACVSNSLPCLLATRNLMLAPGADHATVVRSVVGGIDKARTVLKTDAADIHLHYYHLLVWDGQQFEVQARRSEAPAFASYQEYFSYLKSVGRGLWQNLYARERAHAVKVSATTISSGYDSAAVSAIVREIGVKLAYTLKRRSLVSRDDSGRAAAERLGLEVLECRSPFTGLTGHERFWANMGDGEDMNLLAFPVPQGPSCLFTGFHGDKVWSRHTTSLDLTHLQRGDMSGGSSTEYRIAAGIIHCPLVFCGLSQVRSIQKISTSFEMMPWVLGVAYDRPIPRRILEEAGVARSLFGQKKSAAVLPSLLTVYPGEANVRHALNRYLRSQRRPIVCRSRMLRAWAWLLYDHACLRVGLAPAGRWKKLPPSADELFAFSNEYLRQQLTAGAASEARASLARQVATAGIYL